MPTLVAPVLDDTRSTRADYLELSALLSSRGRSGGATLLSVLDLSEDADVGERIVDESTGELLDEDIVESGREQVVAAAFEELLYRQDCLGTAYPFTIDARSLTVKFEQATESEHTGRDVYLFCLLSSAIRTGQLQGGVELTEIEKAIAGNFQICSCLAAGGFLSHVSSFGFPRATGSAFLPALGEAFRRFGAGRVRIDVPDGMPSELKDGGIDVIAWREFPDQMPGKLYLVGQCASGKNWKSKPVSGWIKLLGAWFTEQPAEHVTPAMFIPFPVHHELSEPIRDTFTSAVKYRCWYEERQFGIIFDRIRIPYLANICMTSSVAARQLIEGADLVPSVNAWITQTLRLFHT